MSVQFISVEELKRRILERGYVWNGEELDVFAAAVIREASVGSVSIRKASEFGMIEFDALVVTRCDDVFAWTKYDLIPHKETS